MLAILILVIVICFLIDFSYIHITKNQKTISKNQMIIIKLLKEKKEIIKRLPE
jgi:hypothetical protein